MIEYYDPRDVRHIPESYPRLVRWRELGPFAASVMLASAKIPFYTPSERRESWFHEMCTKLGVRGAMRFVEGDEIIVAPPAHGKSELQPEVER